jgi:hypothetical protein
MSCCSESKPRTVIRQEDLDRGLAFEIEYAGGRTMRVAGAVTGRAYLFSGQARFQPVDPRDATALLRDRRFRFRRMIPPASGSRDATAEGA